ncbi:MAG: multidrug MFS transporter [Legionellales bacterium RIFCSPHIGHO2_12_FULL_37_14]|nr:MAG: multidrug MFS transporter [Legionellales bacterium RIFCSPHIGHO2_12_FULL_37_14]
MENLKFFLLKFVKQIPVFLYDFLSIPAAWYLAYCLRYNLQPFPARFVSYYAVASFFVIMVVQMGFYFQCKVYRGLWRFASIKDLVRILKAAFGAICVSAPILFLMNYLIHLPRSVLPLYAMIITALWSLGRFSRRFFWENQQGVNKSAQVKRVLVIGAGDAGESLIRDLHRSYIYYPIGVLDDQPKKLHLEVHGVRVLGFIDELPKIVRKYGVELIFIAIPTAGSTKMRHIVSLCEASKVPFRTLPSLNELADGKVEVNSLRPVSLDDLLGRDAVKIDWDKISATVKGKKVLVTGAGGSIGSELCRQILKLNPASLMLIDNSEYQLYKIEQEFLKLENKVKFEFVLASVTDRVAINQHFARYKPEIVFHAAAYKHVPILENQVYAAVLNNIVGTSIVAEICVATKVAKMILISTDKAVNPTNIMGSTKRIAEMYCQALNHGAATQFITVRFGNVLGSTGSVVPLFQEQINKGGPVTVTHYEIERFFMTIPEASQLILQALAIGKGGEIFVLDMGEPIKIRYLAEQMIKLSGREIEITYTGLRPGEKLFEELFHVDEKLVETSHHKLHQAIARTCSLETLQDTLKLFVNACATYDDAELRFLIKSLVPELSQVNANCWAEVQPTPS